ncbi:hypothetical protein A8C56_06385 [Niabella ginsenosidivorans]|uniref:Uncharacterized protein n=1 Tax=Niabella ginsenosidivorans TaxID=1176587 RepID=A0A1A9HZZ5_9BACT|nr:hypothetical protein A8C56_06385 [Niabella ginsenosidivorans]
MEGDNKKIIPLFTCWFVVHSFYSPASGGDCIVILQIRNGCFALLNRFTVVGKPFKMGVAPHRIRYSLLRTIKIMI